MKLSTILSLASAAFISFADLQAQDYFWFDDGGTILPSEGIVDQLNQIVIDYSACTGTENGLNVGNGRGNNWITSDNGNYNVSLSDNYMDHLLTLTVENGPIVAAGSYKLTIPEGAINVYGNPNLINDAVNFRWTVDGTLDTGEPAELHIVSSYPANNEAISLPVTALTLTFDQDITVRHSAFDAAGSITNLTSGGYIQLSMSANGNVLTLTKGAYSSSDFMAGQQYELELYGNHIFSAADPSVSLAPTQIRFSIADGNDTDGLQVMAQIPATGENIRNAGSVTFNMQLTAVDKTKVSLVNEQGHVATLSSVGRDSESPRSLIFNIDPNTHLQGNTTYKLHLNPGAVTAGDYTNAEMDAAYWCIPAELFTLHAVGFENAVPEFESVLLNTETSGITLNGDLSGIMITGVSTNANHIYARLSNYDVINEGEAESLFLQFDQTLTPELLAQGGAIYNSVKLIIPEGTFIDNQGHLNHQIEQIIYVIEEREIGEQTWTFNPTSGSQLDQLGEPWYAEDENGNRVTYYSISFTVSGENVYVRIPDGSKLYMLNKQNGEVVMTFQRNSVIGYNNRFSLELGSKAITEWGIYELVIPAEAINLYSDSNCQTAPIHPTEDVTALWTVGEVESIQSVRSDKTLEQTFDIHGRKASSSSDILIIRGEKMIIR